MREIAKRFLEDQNFTKEEFEELLKGFENKEERAAFQEKAAFLREKYYGNKVFTRGLIEFTNYCKNNCYYCGIRGEIKMQFVTALQRRKFSRAAKRDTTLDSALLSFRGRRSLVYR